MGARGSLESGSGFGAKPWNTVGTRRGEEVAQEALSSLVSLTVAICPKL